MMRSVRYLWAMLATLAFLTQSCDHKDLCYRNEHHTELEIKFDWSNAPNAQPRTMVVQLFRMDGSHYQRREFTSREGGKISIESGEYKILFHNGEMESVTERTAMPSVDTMPRSNRTKATLIVDVIWALNVEIPLRRFIVQK